MIVDKKVKVKVTSSVFKYYKEKGYGPFKNFDIIEVDINDLTKGSGIKINAKCDICGIVNNITFQNYNNCFKRENIYTCNDCKYYKTKITNNKRYGNDWGLQNKEIRKKGEITMLEKFGVNNISKLESIKNDRKDNFKSENFKNKAKITILKKFGVDNVSKLDSIKKQKRETCLKNWGVENPSQSSELFEKAQKSGKRIKIHENINLLYRGTYESDFLDYCYDNKIIVEKGPTIKYKHNNKNKYYHSDFYLPKFNLICEIKSDYYLNKYLDINLSKEKQSLKDGYNFIFIVNKKYDDIKKLIKNN